MSWNALFNANNGSLTFYCFFVYGFEYIFEILLLCKNGVCKKRGGGGGNKKALKVDLDSLNRKSNWICRVFQQKRGLTSTNMIVIKGINVSRKTRHLKVELEEF